MSGVSDRKAAFIYVVGLHYGLVQKLSFPFQELNGYFSFQRINGQDEVERKN